MEFKTLMRWADTRRREENDSVRHAWWTGYIRGLRRAYHGDTFGSDAEHAQYLEAINSANPARAALGRGYRAGLALTWCEPDDPIRQACGF